ncbi:MAG: ISAzo13-like element transposase-related protein, partial [Candidatus Methylomirabilales bacterium]
CGLKVRAELDRGDYPKGTKISDKELAALPVDKHEFRGEWNYTIRPRSL